MGRPARRRLSPSGRRADQEAAGVPSFGVPRRAVPAPVFRRAWEALDQRLEPRKACRVYVGLLHLAAMQGCEAVLADHLAAVLDAGGTPDLEAARAAVVPPVPPRAPAVMVPAPDLAVYDELLRMPTWEMPHE